MTDESLALTDSRSLAYLAFVTVRGGNPAEAYRSAERGFGPKWATAEANETWTEQSARDLWAMAGADAEGHTSPARRAAGRVRDRLAAAVPSPFAAFVGSLAAIIVSLLATILTPVVLAATGATPLGLTPLDAFAIGGAACWLAVAANFGSRVYAAVTTPA